MPPVPELTADLRRQAHEKSLKLRIRRAYLKAWITKPEAVLPAGQEFLARSSDRFAAAWDMTEAQGMKVYDLLRALPRVGPATAASLLEQAGIPRGNTVRKCGPRQRERLFQLL